MELSGAFSREMQLVCAIEVVAAEQVGGGSSGLLGWVIVTWWGSGWWEGWMTPVQSANL